jgi:CheY-like chemotaxis protein
MWGINMARAKVLCIVTEGVLEIAQAVIKHNRIEVDLISLKVPEGLRLAQQQKPDAIFIAYYLSDVDPWDILREVKADERLKDTPIVMFGKPHCFGFIPNFGLRSGPQPDVWLDMPVHPQELEDMLRKLLNR